MIPSSIRRRFGGMTSAVAVRVSGRALAFLLALVLARELGVEGFGIYSFATTWVTVLLVVFVKPAVPANMALMLPLATA